MADYTLAPGDTKPIQLGNVKPLLQRFTAGEGILAGKIIAISTATGTAFLADATNAEIDEVVGIAVNDAQQGQPIDLVQAGYVGVSTVGTVGDVAVLSQTAGGLAPVADLITTNLVGIVGYFTNTGTLLIDINNLGVQKG